MIRFHISSCMITFIIIAVSVNGSSLRRTEESLIEQYVSYCPKDRYKPWETIPVFFRTRALYLNGGYNAGSWDFEPLQLSWNPIENYAYSSNMTSNETRAFIKDLDYDEDQWDCCINHYEDYDWKDFEYWDYKEQIDAYQALGWTNETYGSRDVSLWPESEFTKWRNLTEYQRFMAASKLCHTEQTWDESLPLSEWPAEAELPDAW